MDDQDLSDTASDQALLAQVVGTHAANLLLSRHAGSLSGIFKEADPTRLSALAEAGDTAGAPSRRALRRLRAAHLLVQRMLRQQLAEQPLLDNQKTVMRFLQARTATLDHEVFMVLTLDNNLRLIAVNEMFRGTLTGTSVYPRDVVATCLRQSAARVIFAHNHPSGSAEPSRADETITAALKAALALIDVHVIDHLVVTRTACKSLLESGLL